MLMRDSLGYSAFASKQDALLSHSPLAGLTLPHQFPFNPLTFHPPNFLAPPTSSQGPASTPSPILPQHHALLSAFSQNMKAAPKLWWWGQNTDSSWYLQRNPEWSKASAKVLKTNVSFTNQIWGFMFLSDHLQKYFLVYLYNTERQTRIIQFYIQIIIYINLQYSVRGQGGVRPEDRDKPILRLASTNSVSLISQKSYQVDVE